MIRSDVVDGVMSFEEMDAMMYKIEGEDLYLIGTSEHSMIGKFKGQLLKEEELPLTLTSYSPCFRKESAGRTSGNGFYYLMGDVARLHSAMLSYARDFMINKGFTYCVPPL